MGYRISADPPTKRPGKPNGIPVGRMIIIIGAFSLLGLIALGARQLSTITIVSIPVVGEWQATNEPWRIVFRLDKTIVSSSGPSQPNASEAWTSAPGAYSVDYFGTLWVKLNNGRTYTAALTAESPNRFDLIESGNEGVTVFERVQPLKPNPSKKPRANP